ncbi:transposase [Actinomyces gerencseriae]
MDPFHVIALAAGKVDQCRRRIQRAITGRRGRRGEALHRARRTPLTGAGLLTDTQAERLENLFADERHAPVHAAWGVHQRLIQAYRTEDPGPGKHLTRRLIDSLKQTIPDGLEEITELARTLTERVTDILAHFDHPRASNGPTEAIDGRLEHLRGIALGFRNLTHYTIRSLIHARRPKDHSTATT